MKASILIAFTSDTQGLAQALKREMDPRFNVRLGDEPLDAMIADSLAALVQTLPWFDFAILGVDALSLTASRGGSQNVWSGRAGILVGIFLGAMGSDRVFLVTGQMPEGIGENELDLLGATVIRIPGNFHSAPYQGRAREAAHSICEMIAARYDGLHLQMLPSTVLARGYFENFVLPVCQTLVTVPSVKLNGGQIDISGKRFCFKIVLPKTLAEASQEAVIRFLHERNLQNLALETGNRAYPFHMGLKLEQDWPTFYDYPTTLRASREAAQMVLAGNSVADTNRYSLVEEREINNFQRTLDRLLQEPRAAEFRDRVEILRFE